MVYSNDNWGNPTISSFKSPKIAQNDEPRIVGGLLASAPGIQLQRTMVDV